MIHQCRCGFVDDTPGRLALCPVCRSLFAASCPSCLWVYLGADAGDECLCGARIVMGFDAAENFECPTCQTKYPASDKGTRCTQAVPEPMDGDPQCDGVIGKVTFESRRPRLVGQSEQPVASLLRKLSKRKGEAEKAAVTSLESSETKGAARTEPYGSYGGDWNVLTPYHELESARLAIDARLGAVLAELRSLKDDIFQAQIDDVMVSPYLERLRRAFKRYLKAVAKLVLFIDVHGAELHKLLSAVVAGTVRAELQYWLATRGAVLKTKQSILPSDWPEVANTPKHLPEVVADVVATRLIAGLGCVRGLARTLTEPPPEQLFSTVSLRPSMSIEAMRQTIVLKAPAWRTAIDAVCGPIGLQYLLGLQQLRDAIPMPGHADRQCFLTILDPATCGLSAPGDFSAAELSALGFPAAVNSVVGIAAKLIGDTLAIDYWSTLAVIDEIASELSLMRIRFLSKGGRGRYIVQRTLQSGDTNGVGFALITFPEWSLVYILPPEDVAAAISALQFYAALGIDPARIRISVAWNADLQPNLAEQTAIEEQLARFTRRRIDMVSYGAGANGLYSELVNLNYITNPEDRIYLDSIYQLASNRYQPVGQSTDLLYRAASDDADPTADAKISAGIIGAMDAHVKPEDKKAIAGFVDGFVQAVSPKFRAAVPLNEKAVVSATRHFAKDLHSGSKLKCRPDLKQALVMLFWVRGPQGEEAKDMAFEERQDIYGMTPTTGKPWHHATMQLLATLRAMAQEMASALGVPVYFVPIGDVPEVAYKKIRFYPLSKAGVATFVQPALAESKPTAKSVAKPKAASSSTSKPSLAADADAGWQKVPAWLLDGGPDLLTGGGLLAANVTQLVCLAQQAPSCGQRAAFNAMAMKANPLGDAATQMALANDAGLRALGPLAHNIANDEVRTLLAGHDEIAIVIDLRHVRRVVDCILACADAGDDELHHFSLGTKESVFIVLHTLAIDYQPESVGSALPVKTWSVAAALGGGTGNAVQGAVAMPVADAAVLSVAENPAGTATEAATEEMQESGTADALPTVASVSPTAAKPEFASLRVEAFMPKYADMHDTLVEFFKRLPAFANRNRFNQLYFFRELMLRPQLRVIQVGLRSGAIEQGMYLGIPTVYIDIATPAIQRFRTEDDTTTRMLKMTSSGPYKTFKAFRCLFTENVIGLYNRIVGPDQTVAVHRMVRQALRDFGRGTRADSSQPKEKGKPVAKVKRTKVPDSHPYQSADDMLGMSDKHRGFWEGTLRPVEVRELFDMMMDLYVNFQDHMVRMKDAGELRDAGPQLAQTSGSSPAQSQAPVSGSIGTPVAVPVKTSLPARKDSRAGHFIAVQLTRVNGHIHVHFADSLAAGASRRELLRALLQAMRL